jgi:hypothetical protein
MRLATCPRGLPLELRECQPRVSFTVALPTGGSCRSVATGASAALATAGHVSSEAASAAGKAVADGASSLIKAAPDAAASTAAAARVTAQYASQGGERAFRMVGSAATMVKEGAEAAAPSVKEGVVQVAGSASYIARGSREAFGIGLSRIRAAGVIATNNTAVFLGEKVAPVTNEAVAAAAGLSADAVKALRPAATRGLSIAAAGAATVRSAASGAVPAVIAAGAVAASGAAQLAGTAGTAAVAAGKAGARVAGEAGSAAVHMAGEAGSAAAHMAGEAGTAAAHMAGEAGSAAWEAGKAGAHMAGEAGSAALHAAGEAGTAAAHVAGEAGSAAWEAGKAGAHMAGEAGSAALHAAGEAGTAAAHVAGEAGSAAWEAGKAGAHMAGQAGATVVSGAASVAGAVANSGAVRSAAAGAEEFLSSAKDGIAAAGGAAWGAAGEVYGASRDAVLAAFGAAAGAAAAFWQELIKIEIFRDVYQQLAVFFSTVCRAALDATTAIWNYLANLINFSWDITFSFNPIYMIAIIGVIAIVVVILFIYSLCVAVSMTASTNSLVHGHEAEDWEDLREQRGRTVKLIQYVFTAAISVYLPVSKMAIQVVTCDPGVAVGMQLIAGQQLCTADLATQRVTCVCGGWDLYNIFMYVSIGLIILITIALPIVCYLLVQRNKPKGGAVEDPENKCYVDGKLVDFTDSMYNQRINMDPAQINNPFVFLYKGYERKWAFYKVVQMVFKLLLVLPAVLLLSQGTLATSLVLLAVLAIYAGLSFYASPFINEQADQMDAIGRITALLTVFFALISSDQVWSGGKTAMGVLMNIVNFLSFALMLALILYSLPAVKNWLKMRLGRLSMSDTLKDSTGPPSKIIPEWDLMWELKRRLWQPFFMQVMLSDEMMGGDAEAQKAMTVREKKLSIPRRFMALQNIATQHGTHRIDAHWKAMNDPLLVQKYDWTVWNLEGVDVYYDGIPHDGHLDSTTGFGKMYIIPYPFCCVMVYDEGGDHAYVYGADGPPTRENHPHFDKITNPAQLALPPFEYLYRLNAFDPEVRRRRTVRQWFRSLSAASSAGENFPLHFTAVVSKRERDGQDKDGNAQYSTVQVLLTFTRVEVNVGANSSKPMAAGFKLTVMGIDGTGSAVLPRTGRTVSYSHERAPVPRDQFNPFPDFQVTGKVHELLMSPPAVAAINARMPAIFSGAIEYRRELVQKHMEEETSLSCAFYRHVFDAFPLPRAALEAYFMDFERNPLLREFPIKHKEGLDFVYARLNAVCRHPIAAVWWLVFEDLWSQNHDLPLFKGKEKEFDPRFAESIAYMPKPRVDMEKWCEKQGVKAFFDKNSLLELLYSEIDKRCGVHNPLALVEASNGNAASV